MKNAIIIAGPNGAGKTTFAEKYLDVYCQRNSSDLGEFPNQKNSIEYVSADKIALRLNPNNPSKVRIQAGKAFFQEIENSVDKGKDLLIEVTLSGRGFQRILHNLKQKGYELHIVFIFLKSPELCINRVRGRVTYGGHDVPEEDIRRRFYRSMVNFWRIYKSIADTWDIYSNSGNHFHKVAVGEKDQVDVRDDSLFRLFLDNVKEC